MATVKKNTSGSDAQSNRLQPGGPSSSRINVADRDCLALLTAVPGEVPVAGAYDFDLEYADSATAVTDRALLFTALEEQPGLRLQPRRTHIDLLLVDRVTPPTDKLNSLRMRNYG